MADPAVFWSMVEALATIAAVVLALILSGGKLIYDYLNKPKLFLEVSFPKVEPSPMFRNFNIMIKNKGRETAKKINVKIKKIEFPKSEKIFENIEPGIFLIENLQWEDYNNFRLITINTNNNKLGIAAADLTYDLTREDCKISLLITGDNFKGFHKTFKYENHEDIKKANLILMR